MSYLVQNISGAVASGPKVIGHIASTPPLQDWAIGQIDWVDDMFYPFYAANTTVFTILAGPSVTAGISPATRANAVTAFAGGGQTNATALTASINRISTVATSGDSVKLPATSAGISIVVINDALLPMQVYGAGTDTINDVATATGVTQIPQSVVVYYCTAAGNWMAQGTGLGYSGSLANIAANTAVYSANTATTAATLSAASLVGAADVTVNMTGTLGAGAALTLPTVAQLVAAMPNAVAGVSYRLRIMNTGAGAFAWTVTAATGWTLNGTMTVANLTYRDFIVTLNTATTATLQSLGQVTTTAV